MHSTSTSGTPIISVIIPTRDRPETLKACLSSLRRHVARDIEIVVQDNFSSADTSRVVAEAQRHDPRVRYNRSSVPLSQRQNFEAGVSAARGDYLAIIGDDDGFCLGSLDFLADFLRENPVDAVRWHLLHYAWPDLSTDGEGFIRIYDTHYYGGWSISDSKEIASKTLNATNAGSWDNILIYHGMISRRLYDRIRAHTDGIFFHYPMIDVFAHNLIAFFCDRLLNIYNPVSIYGTSSYSAGTSWARSAESEGRDASEGNKWIVDSKADPVAEKIGWQPEIRTLRYHDYRVLKLAASWGMIDAKPDRDIWVKAVLDEVAASPWTASPWLRAKPVDPDDEFFISAVTSWLTGSADQLPPAPSTSWEPTYDHTILRVRYVTSDTKDDVESAMLAIASLMDDGSPIYDFPAGNLSDDREQKPSARIATPPQAKHLWSRLLEFWPKSTSVPTSSTVSTLSAEKLSRSERTSKMMQRLLDMKTAARTLAAGTPSAPRRSAVGEKNDSDKTPLP